MFENLKLVIVGAAAIVALVPGAGLMLGALELPTEFNAMLGLASTIVGTLVFFVVFLARPWIMKQRTVLLIAAVTVLGLGGIALGFAANTYTDLHIGEYRYMDDGEEKTERYLVPDTFDEKLQARINREAGNITNAINRDRSALDLLHKAAWPVRIKASAMFLIAQIMLITAFLSAAWAVAAKAAKETVKAKAESV